MRNKKHAQRTKRLQGYFTPRLARVITTADGREIPVHINRRGCTTRWSDEDARALQALVEAVHALTPKQISELAARTDEEKP
jgi:hypothetical protein